MVERETIKVPKSMVRVHPVSLLFLQKGENGCLSNNLGSMDDSKFDKAHAIDVIRRFLNRDYGRDGKGGLFTIEHCRYDMRDIEIWYQANWYLDNIR